MTSTFRVYCIAVLARAAAALILCLPAVQAGPVNINSADAGTIARELKGIGLKRAQLIVEYRVKHGPYKSVDELGLVKGIGRKVIQNNKADIRVDAVKPVTTPPSRTPPDNAAPRR